MIRLALSLAAVVQCLNRGGYCHVSEWQKPFYISCRETNFRKPAFLHLLNCLLLIRLGKEKTCGGKLISSGWCTFCALHCALHNLLLMHPQIVDNNYFLLHHQDYYLFHQNNIYSIIKTNIYHPFPSSRLFSTIQNQVWVIEIFCGRMIQGSAHVGYDFASKSFAFGNICIRNCQFQ